MKQPSLMVCTTLVFACPVLDRNLLFFGADPSGLVSPDGRMWIYWRGKGNIEIPKGEIQ